MEGGPIAFIEDGDLVHIDIPGKSLKVDLSGDEFEARKADWKCPPSRVSGGYLSLYAKLASSAAKGAVLEI